MTIETPQQRKPLKTVISKAILLPALFVVVLIALAAVIGMFTYLKKLIKNVLLIVFQFY